VKVYILLNEKEASEKQRYPIAYYNKDYALAAFKRIESRSYTGTFVLHEIDFDPHAGFQTVNVTQINPDGTSESDNYAKLTADRPDMITADEWRKIHAGEK
jgi:hypothetical protein